MIETARYADSVLYADREVINADAGMPNVCVMPEDVRAAYELWLGLSGDDELPSYKNFHLDDFAPTVIPRTIIYEVVAGGADYRYRFFGTQRVQVHGEDYTGRHVSDMKPRLVGEKIASELGSIRRSRKPLMIKTTAAVDGNQFEYFMLRVPFASADRAVSHMLAIAFNGTGPEVPDRLVRSWFRP